MLRLGRSAGVMAAALLQVLLILVIAVAGNGADGGPTTVPATLPTWTDLARWERDGHNLPAALAAAELAVDSGSGGVEAQKLLLDIRIELHIADDGKITETAHPEIAKRLKEIKYLTHYQAAQEHLRRNAAKEAAQELQEAYKLFKPARVETGVAAAKLYVVAKDYDSAKRLSDDLQLPAGGLDDVLVRIIRNDLSPDVDGAGLYGCRTYQEFITVWNQTAGRAARLSVSDIKNDHVYRALEAIAGARQGKELADVALNGTSVKLCCLAWMAMEKEGLLWSSTREMIDKEFAIQGRLRSKDIDAAVKAKLDAGLSRRLEKYCREPDQLGASLKEIAEALPPGLRGEVDPWLEFDLTLHDLKSAGEPKDRKDADDRLAKLNVLKVRDHPSAKRLRDQLVGLLRDPGTGGGGPGAVAEVKLKWELVAAESGVDVRVYRWNCVDSNGKTVLDAHGKPASLRLVFKRVGGDAYVCTTEVSLKLFRYFLHAAGPPKAGLLPNEKDTLGPRVWTHYDNSIGGIMPNRIWQDHPDPNTTDPYAPSLAALYRGKQKWRQKPVGGRDADPADDMPMQQVPVSTAVYFAHLAGCRLPTVGEWSQALADWKKAPGDALPNLRDQTWKGQCDYFYDEKTGGNAFHPALGAFLGDLSNEKQFWDAGQLQAVLGVRAPNPYDDHWLYFRPVPADLKDAAGNPCFADLLGNVAELVWKDREPAAVAQAQPATAPDQFQIMAAQFKDQIHVIGGSAISPPREESTTKLPSVRNIDEGYADVGFRLAFTDHNAEDWRRKWVQLVTGWAYESPPRAGATPATQRGL